MRALVFDLSLVKYALAKAFGKRVPSLYYGRPSCLQLREVPEPTLRGPAWAKVAVDACGFCGSDLSTIFLKYSPQMSALSSSPSVMGHEIFGRLAEVGAEARAAGFREGDRVAVNPAFGCVVRGIAPPCPACASGHPATCHHAGGDAGGLSPGFSLGFHRELGGGFAEALIAHKTQLYKIPDTLPDRRAVLTEPIAIGVHAVLKRPPLDGEQVLIIGGGMIAYSVLAALRLLGYKNRITQLLLLDFQAEAARALGADDVIKIGAGVDVDDEVIRRTGAHRYRPLIGRDVLTGGYPLVFDCVGTPESVRDSLAYTASQGTVVMVGNAGVWPDADVTALWARELRWIGTAYYGPEPERKLTHTLPLTTELLSGDAAKPLDALITHTFALEQYREAVVANVERGRFKSVKTIFRPRA